MRKMIIYVLFAVAVSVWSHGQEKPKTSSPVKEELKQLSSEDQLALRNAQVDAQQLTLQSMQTQSALSAALQRQRELYETLVLKYHIDEKKEILCDGPSTGPQCSNVRKGEIRRVEKGGS